LTAGTKLYYSKHYISDYIIKRSKKKKRKQKKAARLVNTLIKILHVRNTFHGNPTAI